MLRHHVRPELSKYRKVWLCQMQFRAGERHEIGGEGCCCFSRSQIYVDNPAEREVMPLRPTIAVVLFSSVAIGIEAFGKLLSSFAVR
jgi:hypothetical protein